MDRLRGKEIDIYYDRRDITVIYLFLEGELIGEAYCTEYLHRRVSWWEARAERQADAARKSQAEAESLENRQAIQQKARGGAAHSFARNQTARKTASTRSAAARNSS